MNIMEGKDDAISRQAAIDIVNKYNKSHMVLKGKPMLGAAPIVIELEDLPTAQPDLPETYVKAVWEWLLDYQTTAAELKAKYSAYEVLSWVVNDWRRGHGGLD